MRALATNVEGKFTDRLNNIVSELRKRAVESACMLAWHSKDVSEDQKAEASMRIDEVICNIHNAMKGNSDTTAVVSEEFKPEAVMLGYASIIAYAGGFNNDKDVSKMNFGEKAPDVANGTKFPVSFGYNGLNDTVRAVLDVMKDEHSSDSSSSCMESGLLSYIRSGNGGREDCPATEYIARGHAIHDISLIEFLLTDTTKVIDANDLAKFKRACKAVYDMTKNTENLVLKVYKYLFQNTFGLHPYFGVLSMTDNPDSELSAYTVDRERKQIAVGNMDSDEFGIYSNRVFENSAAVKLRNEFKAKGCEFLVSDARQFDVDYVLKVGKPVYFPKKILEFATRSVGTYNVNVDVYKPADSSNYNDYAKNYIEPYVHNILFGAVLDLAKNTPDYTSVNSDFKAKSDAVLKLLADSLCLAFIFTNFTLVGEDLSYVALRCVDIRNNVLQRTQSFSRKLFKDMANFDENSPEYKVETPLEILSANESSKSIIEYRYDKDPVVTGAEPIFSYQAVKAFKDMGMTVKWSSILFGEDRQGQSVVEGESIHLHNSVVHNIYAGSRSGKGLMTMTLLAGAVASKKAVFYLDRKPDMVSMFYALDGVGKNMFMWNGGLYGKRDDTYGTWGAESEINQMLKAKLKLPDYLSSLGLTYTNQNIADSHLLADFIYLRAIMFMFSLLEARIKLQQNAEIYNALGGKDGVIFVIDETTNWMNDFEKVLLNVGSGFLKPDNIVVLPQDGEIAAKMAKIEDDIKKLDGKEATKESESLLKTKKTELLKLQLEATRSLPKKPLAAYCTELIRCLKDVFDTMRSEKNAGFQQNEDRCTDVFVLGQEIPKNTSQPLSGKDGDWFKVKANPADGYYASASGNSVLRAILDQFANDWFIGANVDGCDFKLTADNCKLPKDVQEYRTTSRSFWTYYCSGSTASLSLPSPTNEPTAMFKPYLVLNNNLEWDVIPKDYAAQYKYLGDCATRVIGNGGERVWKTVRYKNRAPEYKGMSYEEFNSITDVRGKQYLNAGIGFKGLAELVASTTGEDLDVADVLNKSGRIANYVAQCCGYDDFWSLLFDLRPEGLFTPEDIVRAVSMGTEAGPQYFRDISRLPNIAVFGAVGDASTLHDEDVDDTAVDDSMGSNANVNTMDRFEQSESDNWGSGESEDTANSETNPVADEDNFDDLPQVNDGIGSRNTAVSALSLGHIRKLLIDAALNIYAKEYNATVNQRAFALAVSNKGAYSVNSIADFIVNEYQQGILNGNAYCVEDLAYELKDCFDTDMYNLLFNSDVQSTTPKYVYGAGVKTVVERLYAEVNSIFGGESSTSAETETTDTAETTDTTETTASSNKLSLTTVVDVLYAWVQYLWKSEGCVERCGNITNRDIDKGGFNSVLANISANVPDKYSAADFWCTVPGAVRDDYVTADSLLGGNYIAEIENWVYAIVDTIQRTKTETIDRMGSDFGDMPVNDTDVFNKEKAILRVRPIMQSIFDLIVALDREGKVRLADNVRAKIATDEDKKNFVELCVNTLVDMCVDNADLDDIVSQLTAFEARIDRR